MVLVMVVVAADVALLALRLLARALTGLCNLVVALHQSTDDVQRSVRPADGEAEQQQNCFKGDAGCASTLCTLFASAA